MFEEVDFDEPLDISKDLDRDDMDVVSDVDVERLVKAVRKCREETEFLKKLKSKRVEPIDLKIEKLKNNEEKLKAFIVELIPEYFPNKNSVDFPGVGKVTRRKQKGKWIIDDEAALRETLEKFDELTSAIEVKEVLNKTKAKKCITNILKDNSPDEIDGAYYEEPDAEYSLSVQIHDDSKNQKTTSTDIGF
jgi:hypothetical protein